MRRARSASVGVPALAILTLACLGTATNASAYDRIGRTLAGAPSATVPAPSFQVSAAAAMPLPKRLPGVAHECAADAVTGLMLAREHRQRGAARHL